MAKPASTLLSLLLALAVLTSCGSRATLRPFIQTPADPTSIDSLQDLDREVPFYGIVKLMDGREFEGTVLGVEDVLEFKSAFREKPRRMEFALDDVMRVKMYDGGTALDYGIWAILSAAGGAVTGYVLKGGSNLRNALVEGREVDVDGIRRWTRWGALFGLVTSPLAYHEAGFSGGFHTVYDASIYGEVESYLPAVDWSGWDAEQQEGE